MAGGGHVWQGGGHVWQGGMHGRGCAWHREGMRGIGGRAWQILRDTVNERAVRIVLECILVNSFLSLESRSEPRGTAKAMRILN